MSRFGISAPTLLLLGFVTGVLSGMFGVGGGILMVPMLMLLGMPQRLAAGTSTTAILPAAIVGATGYGLSGQVDWLAGLLLALGVVVGAQVGSLALSRIDKSVLFWIFLAFMLINIVSLWLTIPQRDDVIELTAVTAIALVGVGVFIGALAGLLGIGGGVILVPILMSIFGASDLIARGTSLVMMVPGSVSATLGNIKRSNLDIRVAGLLGVTACLGAPLGVVIATLLTPLVSNILFSVLVAVITVQMLVNHLRRRSP